MRVLFISKYAVSPAFGEPTRQYFYCKYLSRLNGNHVWLISSRSATCDPTLSFRGRQTEQVEGRLTHTVLNGPRISLGMNLIRIWSWIWFEIQLLRSYRQIRRWTPDVIIVSSLSIMTFLTGVFLARMLNRPLVIEVRDVYPATLISLAGYHRFHPTVLFLGWIEKLGYRRADAIISSLPNLGPHVQERIGKAKEVTYLPMGFDPELEQPTPLSGAGADVLDKIKSLGDKFLVGYAGTIGLANALAEPLAAFRELQRKNSGIHLVLIGDGPLKKKYQQEFEGCSNIHFVGRVPKTDLQYLLPHLSILINPWLNSDIYQFGISPNKWIDYLQAGKPILCSYRGFQFLLEQNQVGWFIQPQNAAAFREAILNIASLPKKELQAMGTRGQTYLKKNLLYQQLAQKLETILIGVIKNKV